MADGWTGWVGGGLDACWNLGTWQGGGGGSGLRGRGDNPREPVLRSLSADLSTNVEICVSRFLCRAALSAKTDILLVLRAIPWSADRGVVDSETKQNSHEATKETSEKMGLKYEMLENLVKSDVKYEEFQVEGDINISTIENLMTFNFDQRLINDSLFLLRFLSPVERLDLE